MALRAMIGAEDAEEIKALLTGLVALNLGQLRRGLVPPLYASGVRYVREPRGQESWQSAQQVYRARGGDCEDLAAYRAAEYHMIGKTGVYCDIIEVRPGLKHCVVRLEDGTIEDPSKRLGMSGRG